MASRRCELCGAPVSPWDDVCRHRKACEARQMLAAGEPSWKAASHAQRLGLTFEPKPRGASNA